MPKLMREAMLKAGTVSNGRATFIDIVERFAEGRNFVRVTRQELDSLPEGKLRSRFNSVLRQAGYRVVGATKEQITYGRYDS